MNNKGKAILAAAAAALFLLLLVLVRVFDVAPIGPAGTGIGLSHLNQAVHTGLGVHMGWYTATQALGAAAILLAAVFAVVGVLQLIRRRSLARVDLDILALGALYAAVLVLYVLFEKVVINCRPILMEGAEGPEASFPSSHTMLACTVFASAAIVLRRRLGPGQAGAAATGAAALLSLAMVVGRLLSGVHWLTDILAAVLLSTALVSLYAWAIGVCDAAVRRE